MVVWVGVLTPSVVPILFLSIPRNTIILSSLQDLIASGGEKGWVRTCKVVVAGKAAGLAGVAPCRPLAGWEVGEGQRLRYSGVGERKTGQLQCPGVVMETACKQMSWLGRVKAGSRPRTVQEPGTPCSGPGAGHH